MIQHLDVVSFPTLRASGRDDGCAAGCLPGRLLMVFTDWGRTTGQVSDLIETTA